MKNRRSMLVRTLIAIMMIVLVVGCGSSQKGAEESAKVDTYSYSILSDRGARPEGLSGSPMMLSKAEASTITRKIIQNADVYIAVTDVRGALNRAIEMAEAAGGMVSDLSISKSDGRVSGSVTLRVPAGKFVQFLTQLSTLGDIRSQQSSSQEVTEEFIDLEARIKNLESQEEALRGLLAGSKNVADALSVEKELARVRSEIDSLNGRLRFLSDQVDLSTIRLTLIEETPLEQRISASGLSGIGKRSAQAFARAANAVFDFIGDLVVFVVGAVPVLIFLAIIGVPAWFLWKRIRGVLPGRKSGREV